MFVAIGEVAASISGGFTSSEAQGNGMFWTHPATRLLLEELKSRIKSWEKSVSGIK